MARIKFEARHTIARRKILGIEFRQNYYREAQPRAGDMYTAMPWMQSGDLHMTNADVLLNLAVCFMIQPP